MKNIHLALIKHRIPFLLTLGFVPFMVLMQSRLLFAQIPNPHQFNAIRWRMIGPFRGGRTVGATGVPQQPNTFYIGVCNGGVWKTIDAGRTWQPIFDQESTGSIGDVAVAPSDPQVVYAASGEGLQRPDLSVGNGIYRSGDGGKTWQHRGLTEGQQIAGLAIDPRNANRVFAAVLGHPYGPNPERGVFRTTDGGKTWKKVLYLDENTGAAQVTMDPKNPDIIFADLWSARQGPWENGSWQGPGSGLYKSADGGNSWKPLTKGLPTFTQGLGRIGFCIAPSDPKRMYATVDAPLLGGIYRSDDSGESWTLVDDDARLWSRGDDFAECKVDPKNKDIVYDANIVTWKSTDGGKSWTGFRGAPGGDDYHRLWINPLHPTTILLAGDQGAVITVDGGLTWSSWYNQPTAEFYHVSTDHQFPYHIFGGQQESGSIEISSRGNDGQITFREWHPVGAEEYGYIAPDPIHPNIIFGGKLTRYKTITGQAQDISPDPLDTGNYRFLRTEPVLFSPLDPKTLYYAGNVLFKTQDGGHSWQVISPDLTRSSWSLPASIGIFRTPSLKTMPRRGVIYTIAPSSLDKNIIWAGTDDGYIQETRNGGKSWVNVTPPFIHSWNKISIIEAGHFDQNTAFAAVNCIRLDDLHPYIYRTQDGGKSWNKIVQGLPDEPINVIREDPKRKGLLFAGSETAVYVSFDNGDHWQTLRLNMPATSIRDLDIHGDDLIAATHGRSFWILDDITPLRQIKDGMGLPITQLYQPQTAWRVRWDNNTDTPLPPDEPAGQNPPDGAIIDYYLSAGTHGPVTLEILDSMGEVIRKYSSQDRPYPIPQVNIPTYWIRPQQILSDQPGSHRFLWDLHLQPLNILPTYSIGAIYHNTPPEPTSPWVMPGRYILHLRVNSKEYTQSIVVKMDPRVNTSFRDLQQQYELSEICYQSRINLRKAIGELDTLQKTLVSLSWKQKTREDKELQQQAGQIRQFLHPGKSTQHPGLTRLERNFATLFSLLQGADHRPTRQVKVEVEKTEQQYREIWKSWLQWQKQDLPKLKELISPSGLPQS
ncbi:MAG: VPS10 domain-containing protein [Chitinophagaceae bacterium]